MTNPFLNLKFHDLPFSFTSSPMAKELCDEIFSDNYKVFASGLEFRPGDVVLDLGACEGMFSIMIAKCFPQVRVVALEPVPRAFALLERNIEMNHASNVEAHCVGVAAKSGKMVINIGKNNFNGGSSGVMKFNPENHQQVEVAVKSLDDVFWTYGIDRCRLLKIDIEGMEYEVLYNTKVLSRVEFFTGEIHTNLRLETDGYRMHGLANWLADRTQVIFVEPCNMSD